MVLGVVHVSAPPEARACGGDFAPDLGVVQAEGPWAGNKYRVVLEFMLTPQQVVNLQCHAAYLEIDFKLYGFVLPAPSLGWQDYRIKSDLPGATADSSLFDGSDRNASVTGVRTADIEGGRRYFAAAEWSAQYVSNPRVEVAFVPSYWATPLRNAWEAMLCAASNYRLAYCIFGENLTYSITRRHPRFAAYSYGRVPFDPMNGVYIFGSWLADYLSGPDHSPEVWQPGQVTGVDLPASSETPPPPVPWTFENLEGDVGAISPHNANVGRTPAAVEFNGQFYVFHYDATNGDLRYARTSPGWVFDILDGAGGPNGRTTSNVGQAPTAVVYNNQLHVFYYDAGDGNLRHATSSDGVYWNFENLDGDWGSVGHLDGNVGQTPAATVIWGSLQLFYYDAGRGNLRHAWLNGGTWSFENLEGDVGSISHYDTNIGVDPTVTVHGNTLQIFYTDVTAGNLRHAWVDGAGWHFENLDGDLGSVGGLDADVGGNPTAVVYSGNLHVFYYNRTHGNLRHMWSDPWSGWHDEDLDGSPTSLTGYDGDVGSMSTAVVVGNTLQLFVYEAGRGNLRHLFDDGTGWRWENLDGQGGSPAGRLNANVGLDPVATTFGGGLQLFYFDHDNGNLRHAMPQ